MKSRATIFALVAAVLAVLAPVAQAGTTPLSDVQLSRGTVATAPDLVERYVQARASAPAPDLIERYAQARASAPVHDLIERYVHTHTPLSDVQLSRSGDRTATPVLATATGTGFDWADASVGAGVILAAFALGAGLMLALRNTRERFLSA